MMHVPFAPPACHTTTPKRRLWIARDVANAKLPGRVIVDPNVICDAFESADQRRALQGATCEGCLRIPEDHRR